MRTLEIDIETFSSVDLAKSGVYRYCESPDFEMLLFACSVDGGEVKVIDIAQGEKLPNEILEALADDSVEKWSFNASFERICLSKYLGLPSGKYLEPGSWYCTMVWSAYLGLPFSLEKVGMVLGLEKQKLGEGKNLIRYFSMPCKQTKANGGRSRNLPMHDPAKWSEFINYNKQDVEVEIAIKERLSHFPLPANEWANYHLDQKINDRGVRIDTNLVNKAILFDEKLREENMTKAIKLTGLENPNSPLQLKEWLNSQGLEIESLAKKEVEDALKTATGHVKEALELRQELSKSSVKKYASMENVKGQDNRARGLFQFYGANRSGRYSGRLIQVQNLRRNNLKDLELARSLVRNGDFETIELLYDSPSDILSQLVRTAFIPKEGHRFLISDFSAIEARVLSWLAGESWRMEAFAQGEDIYCSSASKMFGVLVEKNGANSHLRQKGKVAELACIAEGQLVLTDKGLVPIEKVRMEHKLWDGENWVEHEGIIFNGIKEVITYEGLTATDDHLVWIEGESRPIQFKQAATSGTHLLQTGNGRQAIRLGENYKPRKKMEGELESLLCFDPVYRLPKDSVDIFKQFAKRKDKRMSKLLPAKANPTLVRQKTNSRKAKMRKSKRSPLSQIWSQGHKIQILICPGSRVMDFSKCERCKTKSGNGSDKQQWSLRKRKYQICKKRSKSSQQKFYLTDPVGAGYLAIYQKYSTKKNLVGNEQGRNYKGSRKCCADEKKKLETNRSKTRVYDIRNAGKHHRFTVSGKLVHNCGYGGSVGALKAMGAIEMGLKEDELQPIVDSWRAANPHIVQFWWDIDRTIKNVLETRAGVQFKNLKFSFKKGILFIELPSGRRLSYVKPQIGINRFGGESITYEGMGLANKWERIESYGAKFVENIVQAISRDILAEAMMRLSKEGYEIVMHIHDEVVLETKKGAGSLEEVNQIMSIQPEWAKGLTLDADGFESEFYKKD